MTVETSVHNTGSHQNNPSNNCPDMTWQSHHTEGAHQRIGSRTERDVPCVFPKAVSLILNFLAQDAKAIIHGPCHDLDWVELRCILKKMLIVSMFSGQEKSQHRCDDDRGR